MLLPIGKKLIASARSRVTFLALALIIAIPATALAATVHQLAWWDDAVTYGLDPV